jgi:cytidylate kinase
MDCRAVPDRRTFIAVAGQIGSGKTEVSRELHKRTGWELISAGGILRRMAVERGMSLLGLNEYAKMDPSIDREIDNYLASLAESPESLIIDSRLAWHFLKEALKVYLIVDPSVAAERVFKADRSDETHPTPETARANNAERQRLERERFISLYSVDPANWRNYDLILDTTTASPAEIASIILEQVNLSNNAGIKPECWLSPKRLVPTKAGRDLPNASSDQLDRLDNQTCVDVVVYRNAFLIVDGHDQVSMALRLQRSLIRVRLVAFEKEQLFGGLSAETFARASTSLPAIYDWEEAHRFRLRTYPSWLDAPGVSSAPKVT